MNAGANKHLPAGAGPCYEIEDLPWLELIIGASSQLLIEMVEDVFQDQYLRQTADSPTIWNGQSASHTQNLDESSRLGSNLHVPRERTQTGGLGMSLAIARARGCEKSSPGEMLELNHGKEVLPGSQEIEQRSMLRVYVPVNKSLLDP